jgi:hypothetical protein
MAKFGLFQDNLARPLQTVEGDYMVHEKDHVTVFVTSKVRSVRDRQVGAFKLQRGQCVKQITP